MNRIIRSFQFVLTVVAGMAFAGRAQAQVQLQVSPASVTLSAQAGNPIPATQILSVTSSGDTAGTHLTFSALVQNTLPAGTAVWLTINGLASGTTPGYITVSAAAATSGSAALPEGVYTGQILIAASGAVNNAVTVPVTFTVARIAAAPASVSFNYQAGGSIPPAQIINVSTLGAALNFSASPSVTSGGNWLELAPTSATTPSPVTVSLNPAVIDSLAAGTYSGAISLTASGDSVSVSVPVTLTVSTGPIITASPASLSFLYQNGGATNITQQNLSLTSGDTPVIFSVVTSISPNPAGVGWLVVSNQTSNITPATLTVGVAPASLPAGSYTGQVNITVNGIVAVAIDVTLTISSNPLISFTPNALTFAYQVGGAAPSSQSVATASTGAALSYTLFATTTIGGGWLAATGGLTTPNPISVAVDPAGLGAGTYNGLVTVTAPGAGNSPQKIPVTLNVTNAPLVVASPSSLIFTYQTGKTAPSAQVIKVTSSTGEKLTFSATSATADGGTWLSAFFVTASTPGSLSIGVSTNNLAPGKYTGTVSITATDANGISSPNSPLAIPVTYYVSDNSLVKVSPSVLSFTTPVGTQSSLQTLALTSTSDALSYRISTGTDAGGPWLVVPTQPGLTPASLTVYALPMNVSPGTYNGTITITATNPSGAAVDDSPVVIPVTLQVVEGTLGAEPLTLTFSQALGSAPPASKTVTVSGTGSQPLNFTAVASTTTGVAWLTIAPLSGATPATLSVSVDGSKLSPGTYLGSVTITAPTAAGSPQTVAVTLTVTGPTISLTPTSLQFSSVLGGPAPAAQTLAVSASSGGVAFTAAAVAGGSSGDWLSVSPASGTTPASLSVSVNPAGLAAGTYSGTVTVTPTAAGILPQTLNVTLTVGTPAIPLPASVVNAASQAPGSVAPGEIISIYGTNMGPADAVFGVITDNKLQTTLAGIQVTFGNTAAPLLYVSATQINAIVPYELTGQVQTHMQVSNYGAVSATLDLAVAAAVPGLFTLTENGAGAGAIINAAGGVNSDANPAPQESVIELYAAGLGQTNPQGVTGNITPADGTGLKTVAGVTVTVAGMPCTLWYAGTAPGFVEGAFQINAQLPPGVPSGAQPVVVSVNGVSSQSGVTVAVQ